VILAVNLRFPYAGDVDGDAQLVVDFLNTFDTETGHDELASHEAWAAWAAARGLPPAGPLATARAARHALRGAAGDDHGDARRFAVDVLVGVVDGVPQTVARDAAAAVLAAAARVHEAGRWARIKLCAAETCRWAFVDGSRNRSRTWCSMEVCGNRAKARSFRARTRRP
jgi:hypothetical protein